MINTVKIGDREIPVKVVRKRMRSITMRINDNLEIEVHCASWISEKEILYFIEKSEGWILKQLPRKEKEEAVLNEGLNGDRVLWLGEEKKVEIYLAKRDFCMVKDDRIIFGIRKAEKERVTKAFRKAANQELEKEILSMRDFFDTEVLHNHQYPEIKVHYMTSKWGVCYTTRNRIVLSTRLIHYPMECTKYVLLHEYCHFLEPNHSAKFWHLVESYMPDYKQWKNRLNGNL